MSKLNKKTPTTASGRPEDWLDDFNALIAALAAGISSIPVTFAFFAAFGIPLAGTAGIVAAAIGFVLTIICFFFC